MSTETKEKKKSGRTPEQQAARDARKAVKRAAETNVPRSTTEVVAESSSSGRDTKGKDETQQKEEARQEQDDEDLLEIDVDAPEPLSKAEARAAKKRQKKGLPELPTKPTSKPKRKRAES